MENLSSKSWLRDSNGIMLMDWNVIYIWTFIQSALVRGENNPRELKAERLRIETEAIPKDV